MLMIKNGGRKAKETEFSLVVTISRIMIVWKSYNERLVRRGEIVLDFDVIGQVSIPNTTTN